MAPFSASADESAPSPTCQHWNHAAAGREWPSHDAECGWTCAGHHQSPINVPRRVDARLSKHLRANLQFGTATDLRVLNIGHAVQVEFSPPADSRASVVVLGDSVANLYDAANPNRLPFTRINLEPLQFHMHATSEHLVHGKSAMLELHLVTKLVATPGATLPKECPEGSDALCLAVFGVLYDIKHGDNVTRGDPTIQQIIDNLPTCPEAGKECVKDVPGWELDLSSFFPDTTYHAYTGSLTTPPCTEGVMWHVFPNVRAVLSEQQAIDLQLALSAATIEGQAVLNRLNNRVVQPRNDRNVFAACATS
ncbi:hypothetical protein CHLNCDRAFT_59547 [Chlorella variabilis]|uniref:carbonic anhydrase n=1 Tax=Chlorella variabilis TaxID=554065 RepID=E1Z3D7_CHLVA|nr:hypothetical protein CHLNCDRAFT_59547 [Chlorella variabilis]EFN59826.1 hypothetical protein CHLNCDRAFT_59547 [Chlorella variabilis]|eukprot:XP_005851928.1 hypothetical protein CHLNCDRAFT_59547 [Chlorella variabilis]